MIPNRQKFLLTSVFFLYIVIILTGLSHHELWGDEIHSWNLAKGSSNFADLLSNIRYEGHPPLWYILLWMLSKITHNVIYIQWLHFFIVVPIAFIILFRSSFPVLSRILILFGYYFIFEYSVLSRNYALGVLLVFCICLIQNKEFKYKYVWYYFLFFLLANVHLLACILAASLHFSLLLDKYNTGSTKREIIFHSLLGLSILLPTLVSIFPPSDSGLNMDYWFNNWHFKNILVYFQAIYKAFLPMPAWWDYHFWNSFFLISLYKDHGWLRIVTYSLSLMFLAIIVYLLWNKKKGFIILITNLILTFVMSLIFPPGSVRYVGYIFIGFLVACWQSGIFNKKQITIFNLLLSLQVFPGLFAIYMDFKYPFSYSYKVKDLINTVPANNDIITDYWCLDNLSAYIDKPFFTVGRMEIISFIKWSAKYRNDKTPYYDGITYYTNKKCLDSVYLMSIHSTEKLQELDKKLFQIYRVKLVQSFDSTIDKSGNVYLYQVKKLEKI